MPPNTDAYRVVPEFTLRRTLPHTVLQSCNEEDFFFTFFNIYIYIYTAHMARRTTLIGHQVERRSGPEVDRH